MKETCKAAGTAGAIAPAALFSTGAGGNKCPFM